MGSARIRIDRRACQSGRSAPSRAQEGRQVMSSFQSKWLTPKNATDKTDKSPSVSSVSAIPTVVSGEIDHAPTYGMPLDNVVDITNKETADELSEKVRSNQTDTTDKSLHDVPSACLGPQICAVVGICGRISCLVDRERFVFADAVNTARSPRNRHRVPDFDRPGDISKKSDGGGDAA